MSCSGDIGGHTVADMALRVISRKYITKCRVAEIHLLLPHYSRLPNHVSGYHASIMHWWAIRWYFRVGVGKHGKADLCMEIEILIDASAELAEKRFQCHNQSPVPNRSRRGTVYITVNHYLQTSILKIPLRNEP